MKNIKNNAHTKYILNNFKYINLLKRKRNEQFSNNKNKK